MCVVQKAVQVTIISYNSQHFSLYLIQIYLIYLLNDNAPEFVLG